ncbi:MAG: DUF5611 family protein [Candidatus Thermoplasmatota archaeon]|nr:DUF5611 family protein [Candidatus Thermoplasmatota archaeon]
MREYSIKKGHNPDVNAIIKNYFGASGEVEKGMNFIVDGIGKVYMRKEKNNLLIETEPIAGMSGSIDVIKKWNDFLFEATGRTAKERKKMLEKEMKGK